MDDSLLGFSMPQPVDTPAALAAVVPAAFATTIERLTLADSMPIASDVRKALHAAALLAASDFETAWSPGVGFIAEGLRSREDAGVTIGIALALLHAASRGSRATWRIDLRSEVRLAVQDLLLPAATALAVTETEGVVLLTVTTAAGPFAVELWPQCGFVAAGAGLDRLVSITGDWGTIRLWSDAVRAPGLLHSSLGSASDVIDTCTHHHQRSFTDALALLATAAPAYRDWVTWAVRRILLVRSPDQNTQVSSTFDWHFGISLISESSRSIGIAEMLVHEASHQYFNVARLLGPVVQEPYNTPYYSPFQRRNRPLERILVAYHAFANVTVFFDRCLEAGIRTPSLSTIEPDVLDVERILGEHEHHLTPLGCALFTPLRDARAARRYSTPRGAATRTVPGPVATNRAAREQPGQTGAEVAQLRSTTR